MLYGFDDLWWILGPTLGITILVMLHRPQLRNLGVVVLGLEAFVLLYLPIRVFFYVPSPSEDGDVWPLAGEFWLVLVTFGLAHLLGFVTLIRLAVDEIREPKNEVPSDH